MTEKDLFYRVKYDDEGNVVINKEDILECIKLLDGEDVFEEFMLTVGAMVVQLCLEESDGELDGTEFIT